MRRGPLLIAAVVSLLSATASAQDQDGPPLSNAIISKSSTLDKSEEDAVKKYIEHWVKQLVGDDAEAPEEAADGSTFALDKETAEARRRLVDPMTNPTASDVFRVAYSPRVSGAIQLARVLKTGDRPGHRRPAVRINALIVLSGMQDPLSVQLAQASLTDRSPAGRYWAAKAISSIAKDPRRRGVLAGQLLKDLVAAVQLGLNKEPSPMVSVGMVQCLVDMNTDESIGGLLQWLNQRVNQMGTTEVAAIDAERTAVNALKAALIAAGENWPMKRETMQQTVRAAYRMAEVCAAVPAANPPNTRLEQDFRDVIESCDYILRRGQIITRFNPKFAMPPPITPIVGTWQQAHLGVIQAWKDRLLKEPALQFREAALEVVVRLEK
jgi:hypothetical protein